MTRIEKYYFFNITLSLGTVNLCKNITQLTGWENYKNKLDSQLN